MWNAISEIVKAFVTHGHPNRAFAVVVIGAATCLGIAAIPSFW